jgi:hypothetical protein
MAKDKSEKKEKKRAHAETEDGDVEMAGQDEQKVLETSTSVTPIQLFLVAQKSQEGEGGDCDTGRRPITSRPPPRTEEAVEEAAQDH